MSDKRVSACGVWLTMSLEQRVRELEAELAAARAEVRATKEKFDTVIGALPVGVALITPDGVVEEARTEEGPDGI